IRLPLAAAAGDEEPAAAKDNRAPSNCRVLIAEDNADAAEMMHVMLEVKGYDVRVVNDGTDAVAVAATFQPHIAFLDIGLPVMDGYEAARRIRAARAAECREWQQCRQLALEAADRGDYEIFHDLAWRAGQTGKRNDPALMYLLARAQALSGRPHDALVMLERLADMGVASDAATN